MSRFNAGQAFVERRVNSRRNSTDRLPFYPFLDIALNFIFYASIPLAFAFADPARNALAEGALLAAFIGTGSSFLAFATIAASAA